MLITKKKFYWVMMYSLIGSLFFSTEVFAGATVSDIQNHWAAKPIQNLADQGVINGYPDGTFKPDQAVTRAELAKMLGKSLGYQPVSGSKYPDIGGHWAAPYMNAMAERKVMNSFNDGNFQPEKAVNRAQLTTFIARILNLAKPEEKFGQDWPESFMDVPKDHWAFRYIELSNKFGLLPPQYKTEFHPDQAVTRGEAAWMIQALKGSKSQKERVSQVRYRKRFNEYSTRIRNDPLMVRWSLRKQFLIPKITLPLRWRIC